MNHQRVTLSIARSIAPFLLVGLLLSSCGGTSAPTAPPAPDLGGDNGDVAPPDEPPVGFASNPYPVRFTISEGDFLEYAWRQRRSGGGVPARSSSGRYRLTFGAPMDIEGYTLHSVHLDEDMSFGSPVGVPRWKYVGVHEGIVLGSRTGSDVAVIFWPTASGYHGTLPLDRGIFAEQLDGPVSISRGSAAGYNLLGFDYATTYKRWESPPKCQIIAGIRVCDHDAPESKRETWESLSRDFFAVRYSILRTSSCCGTFPRTTTLAEEVWLHDTSLARPSSPIRFEPDTIDFGVAAVSGSTAVVNDTDAALVVRPLTFSYAEPGDIPGSIDGLQMLVVGWDPSVPARGSNEFQLDLDRSTIPGAGTYHLLVAFEVDGMDERAYLRLRIEAENEEP